ncbi:methylisocitrate lyase [Paenibacillus larvae]|uniref:methylisocitrate lyase n=1 Tax=Paenibacillus larvae TaxID=1464 RepID=UPI00227EB1B8|nr:methylisocitrate lyase [Paenibacillus larvae]MCY7475512.1 methylisocitrate lyase [Paenibacillus larvae]MDE5167651.1 methylisocitrate lyase [Paenibacillus larvae subsp. larvae]MDR5585343.1 methylisocitrate lyase [Paenibacillus larvae]MDR5601170.1 methylisocitrate lyase [Paenibacillus larvae]
MTWLIEEEADQRQLAEQFRELVTVGPIVKIPGTHDGMAATIARQSGFKAIYLSGAAYTAGRGLPDLGLIYSNEVAERARELIRASGLPVLVDIDTGFGGVLNVARTAKEMVEAKVAAVQIEDQEMPKKCGHLNGKKLVSVEDMVQKIRTIKRISPTLFVIARTDARSLEGMDAAIERARQYIAAGSDGIFPEALEDEEEFKSFSASVHCPLLANMTEFGRTPYYTADQFESWGFRMVIYPVTSLRVAAKAYKRVFEEISQKGRQSGSLGDMQSRKELYDTIRYFDYEELDGAIAKTVLPDNPTDN